MKKDLGSKSGNFVSKTRDAIAFISPENIPIWLIFEVKFEVPDVSYLCDLVENVIFEWFRYVLHQFSSSQNI